MLRRLIGALLAFVFIASPAGLSAQTASEIVYTIDAKVYAGSQLVGQPQFTLPAGSEVAMGLAEPRGYGMRLTVDRDESRPNVANAVRVNSRLYFVSGSEWVLVGAPEIQTVTGATARLTSSTPTVYGPGGYTVEYTVRATERRLTPAEFSSVEDCPLWKELAANDGPLDGVRVKGTLVRASAVQDGNETGDHCCSAGSLRCCFTVPGSCCTEGNTGQRCCV